MEESSLSKSAATTDAPTMQRWEGFALGTEPRTQTKIAVMKDAPTKSRGEEFA